MAATEQVEGEDSVEFHKTHMSEIFGDGFSFSGYERDMVKLNDRNGRFIDVSGISGADSISDGRGTVYADFDNDGDADIFLTAMQRKAHPLFRNNIGADSNYLRVELVGTGVSLGTVYPSSTVSEFQDRTERVGLERKPKRPQRHPTIKVARAILRMSASKRTEMLLSFEGNFMALVDKISPRLVDRILSRVLRRNKTPT